MGVTILYFAVAREAAGTAREELSSVPSDVAALRRTLTELHPALGRVLARCRIAIDREFAADDAPLRDGSEAAIIPPVSGGSGRFQVVSRAIAVREAIDAVAGTGRGAVVTFTGEVRAETAGRRVVRLEYEAYAPMAERKLAEIGAELEREHGVSVSIVHRVGVLGPGEAAVVIACAAPHRTAAFRACEAAIERVKRDVPIWKREVFEDGSVWVGLGP